MDAGLATTSSSSNTVDVSEFLSLSNASPAPELMHTLQPLLPNGNSVETDLSIMSNDLDAISAADMQRPASYDFLSSAGVTEAYSTSGGTEVGYASTTEINVTSISSVDIPVNSSQYYVQSMSETSIKPSQMQDTGSKFGQLNLSAAAATSPHVPSSSSHLSADLLSVPNNIVLPTTQTFGGSLQPTGVVDVSTPPKKPLSPYMRFSKGIWQKVKSANPSLSVCEVGATIGRMWREMSDTNKQHFNDDFALDKLRYDTEMQQYLIANGLQASDLSKSKKKKDSKEKVPSASATSAPTQPLVTLTPEQMAEEMARTILESAGICADPAALSNLAGDAPLGDDQLPSFSHVWSGADTIAPAQLCLSANPPFVAAGTTVPLTGVTAAASQSAALCSFPGDGQLFANGDMVSNQLLAAGDDAASWLWQQCATADGQTSGIASAATIDASSLANVSSLNDFILAMDGQLEPGEVRPAVSVPSQAPDSGIAGAWPTTGRDAAELALLRNALVARGKEAARLTRELELAYKLIEQLQQQNIAYQQLEWNFGQPTAEPVSQQQVDSNVGLMVANGIN